MDAAEAYILAGGETTYLEPMIDTFGHVPLSEIDQSFFDRMARVLYPTQSASSIKRWFYTPLIAILNHAARQNMCARPMIKNPKVKRPPADYCEIEWLEKLWSAANPRVEALTKFLPYTGCRISECIGLTWDRVNLDEVYAFIPKTKNNEPRTVHLPEIVIEAFKRLETTDLVFDFKTRHVAVNAIRRTCKRANIEYKRPHVIGSHTYATWMRRYHKVDSVGLTMTGRWKDPRSTQIYAHAHISEVAKKADEFPIQSGAKNVQTKNKAS